jgi:hypothetical protein
VRVDQLTIQKVRFVVAGVNRELAASVFGNAIGTSLLYGGVYVQVSPWSELPQRQLLDRCWSQTGRLFKYEILLIQ